MSDRIPPHNLEAEMAVLGSALVDRNIMPVVANIVAPEDFYAHVHATLFEALRGLSDRGQPMDKIAVAEELRRRDALDRVGGLPYLNRLMDTVQTATSASYYAQLVAEKARLRRMISAAKQIYQLGFEGEDDPGQAVQDAERILREATRSESGDGGFSARAAARLIYDEIDAAISKTRSLGISWPYKALQTITGGIHPGEVVVVAGAPGMGKSVMGVQTAEWTAEHHGPALYFALEMGVEDTTRRIIASRAGLNVRAMRQGQLRPADFDAIGGVMGDLSELPLWFYDARQRRSVADISRIARAHRDKAGCSLIVVDHPGYLADVVQRGRKSKHEALDLAYQELALVAKEVRCPVIIVQHVNRAGMNDEPTLAHLRDGGNLEGIAHIVVFPYRPDMENDPSTGHFIVPKNRDGEIGRVPMHFDGGRFIWRDVRAPGGVA